MRHSLSLLVLAALLGGCAASKPTLRPFYTDGCTMFPDGTPANPRMWCECCFRHDIAYWRGGTEAERLAADDAFRVCVQEKTGDEKQATVMYEAVRLGGAPVFPNWYRWGYGWYYGRGYDPLTPAEREQVSTELAKYEKAVPGGYCARR